MMTTITATERYLPSRVIRNKDLTQFPANAIPLIAQKTGVLERRHAEPGEFTSDLAAKAGIAALVKAGMAPSDLEAIVLATSSPDRIQPATAARVQALMKACNACAFDVNSVCAGAVFAIAIADAFIQSGRFRNTLVIGSEIYSRMLNPQDFSTYPYFGDGAGAALLGTSDVGPSILQTVLHTDGNGSDIIQIPGGGTMKPFGECEPQDMFFRMRGKDVFDFAVTRGSEVLREALGGTLAEQVRCVITHQANVNIITEISKRTNIPRDKFFVNLDKYGNTAAASVLIALDEAREQGATNGAGILILAAFGGGLSWGAVRIKL